MMERQKCSYAAEITSNELKQRILIDVILEDVDRERAEKIISEMETVKEKIKNIMAE